MFVDHPSPRFLLDFLDNLIEFLPFFYFDYIYNLQELFKEFLKSRLSNP